MADTRSGNCTASVQVLTQLSSTPCLPGFSFGCTASGDGASVWTSRGCRALFSCPASLRGLRANVSCGANGKWKVATCPCDSGVVTGSANPGTEAHVTVAFGDGIHACAAAINGLALAKRDPQRAHVAYTWDANEATLKVLSHSWRVVQVPRPPVGAITRATDSLQSLSAQLPVGLHERTANRTPLSCGTDEAST